MKVMQVTDYRAIPFSAILRRKCQENREKINSFDMAHSKGKCGDWQILIPWNLLGKIWFVRGKNGQLSILFDKRYTTPYYSKQGCCDGSIMTDELLATNKSVLRRGVYRYGH